jgi:hypothetical protein
VAPIEFTMPLSQYAAMGGYMDHVKRANTIDPSMPHRFTPQLPENPWPLIPPTQR